MKDTDQNWFNLMQGGRGWICCAYRCAAESFADYAFWA